MSDQLRYTLPNGDVVVLREDGHRPSPIDVLNRFLAGESMGDIALSYGLLQPYGVGLMYIEGIIRDQIRSWRDRAN